MEGGDDILCVNGMVHPDCTRAQLSLTIIFQNSSNVE